MLTFLKKNDFEEAKKLSYWERLEFITTQKEKFDLAYSY